MVRIGSLEHMYVHAPAAHASAHRVRTDTHIHAHAARRLQINNPFLAIITISIIQTTSASASLAHMHLAQFVYTLYDGVRARYVR